MSTGTNIRLLLILDQTIRMSSLDAKLNASSVCESILLDLSAGDDVQIIAVDTCVHTIHSLRTIKQCSSDISWMKGTVMDWEVTNGNVEMHKGLEYAVRMINNKQKDSSSLGQAPTIVVIATDGSKGAQSSILTSQHFLTYMFQKYKICRASDFKLYICMATQPQNHDGPCAIDQKPQTIIYNNNLFQVSLFDISSTMNRMKSKWVIRGHIHALKAQRCQEAVTFLSRTTKGTTNCFTPILPHGLRAFPPGLNISTKKL